METCGVSLGVAALPWTSRRQMPSPAELTRQTTRNVYPTPSGWYWTTVNTYELGPGLPKHFGAPAKLGASSQLPRRFHYTPTHGSWLNMAEIELSVFSRGCLNRRISDEAELRREVAALERERNAAKSAIDWRFTTQDARRKLQHQSRLKCQDNCHVSRSVPLSIP